MIYLTQLVNFLLWSPVSLAQRSPRTLALAIMLGLLLAGTCWWICTNYYRLWNNRFQMGQGHLALCGIAAALTVGFTTVFAGLPFLVRYRIEDWSRIGAPRCTSAVDRALQALSERDLKDFAEPNCLSGNEWRIASDATRRVVYQAYLESILVDFGRLEFFLGRLVAPSQVLRRPDAMVDSIMVDRARKLARNPANQYHTNTALEACCVPLIRGALLREVPTLTYKLRAQVVLLFLLFQAIPFAAVGWSAYRDLKEQT